MLPDKSEEKDASVADDDPKPAADQQRRLMIANITQSVTFGVISGGALTHLLL